MRNFMLYAVLLLSGCTATAQEIVVPPAEETIPVFPVVKPGIIMPRRPVVVQPTDPPVLDVPTSQEDITTLPQGYVFPIESPYPLVITGSPDGFLVVKTYGPTPAYFKFVDGKEAGVEEYREYKSPYVYFILPKKAGKIELLVIPKGEKFTSENDMKRQPLNVMGTEPRPGPEPKPEPDPKPDPKPEPKPDPTPTPTKLQVVIIEDPILRGLLTIEQIAVMDGAEVREYCKTHCVITNGSTDFRKLSVSTDLKNQPQWVKDAFAETRSGLPFLVILTPTKTISGPLPATIAGMLELLKRYGGE